MTVKFLIDAHLPISIAEYFHDQDIVHTSELPEGNNTTDFIINTLSVQEQRIVISKDSDFYYSYLASRKPHKLVLVKLGNMRIQELKSYFQANAAKIISLMKDHSFIILEKGRIRILE